MKNHPRIAFIFAALLAAAGADKAKASLFSDSTMEMLVVAETSPVNQPSTAPAQDNSSSYVAFDGGYIEAGDAIGGETAPSAAVVSQSLQAALGQQGFRQTPVSPAVVLTYHWGVLRVDHREIRKPYSLKENLMARIELVGTEQLAAAAENHILGRRRSGDLNPNAPIETELVGPGETVLARARQPHYFVIVSAYDYQSLLRHEEKLLWRTKLSTQDKSGSMEQVIPALIADGAVYFGKNFSDVKSVQVPLAVNAVATNGPESGNLLPGAAQLDKREVDSILKKEHDKFSGDDD